MGQKNNPILLRLAAATKSFDNSWYSDSNYTKLLSMDLSLYTYINNFLKFLKLPSTRLSIQHLPKTTKLYIFFCYPLKSRELKSKMFHISSSLSSFNNDNFKKTSFRSSEDREFCLTIQDYNKKKAIPDYFSKFNKYNTSDFTELHKINSVISRNEPLIKNNFSKPILSLDSKYLQFLMFFNILQKKQELISLLNSELQVKAFLANLLLLIEKQKFNKYLHSTFKNQLTNFNKNLLLLFYLKNSTTLRQLFNLKNLTNQFKYKQYLAASLSNYYKSNIQFLPFKINNEWQSANYFADELVYLLERRISFRRVKNFLLKQITQNPQIRGIRIVCSGRVGGKSKKSQRAKIESFKYGQTSLHVFSSKLDFAIRTAHTPLGSTGIKVWICYN